MPPVPATHTTVFVCVTCRQPAEGGGAAGDGERRPGLALAGMLAELLRDDPAISVAPAECLAVCKRPCTVALAAPGKWTYVAGGLDPVLHAGEAAAMARAFAATEDGIVPWKERPATFRQGVIARIPPIVPPLLPSMAQPVESAP